MAKDHIQEDLDALIKKAQSQPGITELMHAYGRYNEVMEQSKSYIEGQKAVTPSSVSTQSH